MQPIRQLLGHAASIASVTIATLCLAGTSHAMGVDFEPVVGTLDGSTVLVFEFDITASGDYIAILTDLASPAPFEALALGLADANGVALDEISGAGQLRLNFSVDPGQYVALVAGLPDGDVNVGSFGLEISNVPVPGVGILMMSALASLGFVRRRA